MHTCSYYCDRPECLKRQRDELRARLEALTTPPAEAQAQGGGEVVAWQHRMKFRDGRWSGWAQSPSEEEAAWQVDSYKEHGIEAEYRRLYAEPQPAPPAQGFDADVVDRALEYLRPHLEAGTFAAPYWAIQLASILTGGDGCGKPVPTSAPVGVETVDAAAWIEVLELPDGFRVAEHLPGVWEYQFDIEDEADEDSDRKVSGASWNHPAIAAIAAWGHAYDALAQRPTAPRVRCGDERYELDAYLWRRESTQEWVLELSGTINDTSFVDRFPVPLSYAPEDAVSLPNYTEQPAAVDELVLAARELRQRQRDYLSDPKDSRDENKGRLVGMAAERLDAALEAFVTKPGGSDNDR